MPLPGFNDEKRFAVLFFFFFVFNEKDEKNGETHNRNETKPTEHWRTCWDARSNGIFLFSLTFDPVFWRKKNRFPNEERLGAGWDLTRKKKQ